MRLKFCGAARTVTGSCHLLTLDNGYRILLDCGLYQGNDPDFDDFNQEWGFDPSSIDVVILSHSHIDHSGRIPRLIRDGFEGEVICTSATRDLSAIMLTDSAFIQEKDTEFLNRRRKRQGQKPLEPLYTVVDARKAMDHFVGIGYDRWFKITDGVEVYFADAGHILGSSSVTLRFRDAYAPDRYIGFTGDIGRPHRPILKDPTPIMPCDYLICESTYGGESHQGVPEDRTDLLEVIHHTCIEKKGKLIIPAFSVGRTQELIFMMDQLENEGLLPRIPVYVDSPMAIDATSVFRMHPECFDEAMLSYIEKDSEPFGFGKLRYTKKVEASKAINLDPGPAIIVSASGMMQAGRIKHHLSHGIEDERNTILVVGFCAEGTLGRLIRDGVSEVKIFGETKQVKAEIHILDSFSAHGDQEEMLSFLRKQKTETVKKIFLVHGEIGRQKVFKEALQARGFAKVDIPVLHQEYRLY